MSDTLVCLCEPFHVLNVEKAEPGDSDPSNMDYESLKKSKATHMQQICNLTQNERNSKDISSLNQGCSRKQLISRKREASNVLIECGKRRDNTRNFFIELDMPSQQFSQDIAEKSSNVCDFSPLYEESVEFESLCLEGVSSNADLSDSVSLTDSGIGSSSKGSSPCHSIEALASQDDGADECPSVSMGVENSISIPALPHDPSNSCDSPISGQSPVPIHEDLHDLHLTDVSPPKSPISESLFSNVAPTIHFATKDEKVAPYPDHVLPFLKWRLSPITPILIKEIVQKSGFVLLDAKTPEEWLGTWGKHLKCAAFKKIKTYQKVNHYPGSFHLGRKDKLWENYKRMQTRHGTEAFNFFPETFHLPHDMNLLKNIWDSNDEKCWIIKPPASARGTGVKVIHKWSQIPKNKPIMVQRYVSDPYLINGTKFDLRIYVFVSSIEPLRIYMFEDGLVRFASEKYSLSNKSFANRFVHLTNYSINKKSSSYTANEDETLCQGHKWTLKTFWTYMSNSGIDTKKIQDSINDMILKTIISSEGPICRLTKTYAKTTYNCYELFGFDIMLDKNLRPWLLEVNISPSLHTRSTLDAKIKGSVVKDMFNMSAFLLPEKRSTSSNQKPADYGILCPVANKHKALRYRCLSQVEKGKHSLYTFQYENFDILSELTPDDVRCLIESEDEFNRRGAFIRIFPSAQSSKYFIYFEHIRYYNLLLDAWENNYHNQRDKGILLLQDLCKKRFHLQAVVSETSQTQVDEAEIEITVH